MSALILVLTMAMIGVGLLLACMLAAAPGYIARSRRHSKADAINTCGWIGLFVWPAWIVALVWAYTENNTPAGDAIRAMPYVAGRPPTPCTLCGEVLRLNPGERAHCPKCGAMVAG